MNNLEDWEIRYVVNGLGSKLFLGIKGQMHKPVFADGRKDICAVKYKAVDGRGAFEAIFLVWKDSKKNVYYLQIDNINDELLKKLKEDFIDVANVSVDSGCISIKISSGGTLSGEDPWNRTIEIPIDRINRIEC